MATIEAEKAPAPSLQARHVPTFAECANSWVKRNVKLKKWKPTTADKNAGHVAALQAALGHIFVDQLRLEDVEDHLAHLNGTKNPIGKPYAASTIRTRVTVLSAILNDAIRRGDLERGAVDLTGLKPKLPEAQKVLAPAEVEAFLSSIRTVDAEATHGNAAPWFPLALFLARLEAAYTSRKASRTSHSPRHARKRRSSTESRRIGYATASTTPFGELATSWWRRRSLATLTSR